MTDYTFIIDYLKGRKPSNQLKDNIRTTMLEDGRYQYRFASCITQFCADHGVRINRVEFNQFCEDHGYMYRYFGNGYIKTIKAKEVVDKMIGERGR